MRKRDVFIVATPGTVSGAPRVDGTRLTVEHVVRTVHFEGKTACSEGYDLSLEEIDAAIKYCARKFCLLEPYENFCHTCTLCTENEPPIDYSLYQEVEMDGFLFVRGPNELFMGSMQEFKDEHMGKDWWEVAATLLENK